MSPLVSIMICPAGRHACDSELARPVQPDILVNPAYWSARLQVTGQPRFLIKSDPAYLSTPSQLNDLHMSHDMTRRQGIPSDSVPSALSALPHFSGVQYPGFAKIQYPGFAKSYS